MATFNAVKTGFISDPTTFGNAVGGAVPTDGDTVDVKGFSVLVDVNFSAGGIIPANTSTGRGYLQPVNGNIIFNIASMGTQTAKCAIMGSPGTIELNAAGSIHAKGVSK